MDLFDITVLSFNDQNCTTGLRKEKRTHELHTSDLLDIDVVVSKHMQVEEYVLAKPNGLYVYILRNKKMYILIRININNK